jgi:hypothetical protein
VTESSAPQPLDAPDEPTAYSQAPAPLPPVIPYVDQHTGSRRALWLHLTPPAMGRRIAPVVSIDGRSFIVFWGTVGFEVPADRPVHVSVHVVAEALAQAASMLLLPEHKAEWTYHTLPGTGVASLA